MRERSVMLYCILWCYKTFLYTKISIVSVVSVKRYPPLPFPLWERGGGATHRLVFLIAIRY